MLANLDYDLLLFYVKNSGESYKILDRIISSIYFINKNSIFDIDIPIDVQSN